MVWAFVGVLAVPIVLAALEARRRHRLYWYDTRADYRFVFSGPDVQKNQVSVSREGFVMPELTGGTVLLRLDVRSRFGSIWLEPSVSVKTSNSTCRQFFERRARGHRYVNLCLSAGRPAAGDTVHLHGHLLAWRPQDAELLAFPSPNAGRLLVLAPHADDAEIAAFGLYAGSDAWIATITSGSYAGPQYAPLLPDRAERDLFQGRLRLWDAFSALHWAGLPPERAVILGYPTNSLEGMHAAQGAPPGLTGGDSATLRRWRGQNLSAALDERPAEASWENLVGDMVAILERVQPGTVVAPHPALDGNRDHVFTAAALLAALERLGDPQMTLLLYTNHHVLSEFYPFGPASGVVTLPPWFDSTTVFRSVYSLPLPEERVLDKLFALDQMHDLRPPPEFVSRDPLIQFLKRSVAALTHLWRDPAQELSYFRRAPRPNELFFTYGSEDRAALQELVRRSDRHAE